MSLCQRCAKYAASKQGLCLNCAPKPEKAPPGTREPATVQGYRSLLAELREDLGVMTDRVDDLTKRLELRNEEYAALEKINDGLIESARIDREARDKLQAENEELAGQVSSLLNQVQWLQEDAEAAEAEAAEIEPQEIKESKKGKGSK